MWIMCKSVRQAANPALLFEQYRRNGRLDRTRQDSTKGDEILFVFVELIVLVVVVALVVWAIRPPKA